MVISQLFRKNRMWGKSQLKDKYDVVIIGAGVHGLATAYYLGKLGVTNVAVLDKGYVGGGASARTTAIIRSNYLTPQAVPFFRESVKLYEDLSNDLEFNLLFSQIGRLELGHTDSSMFALRQRAEINQLLGVDSQMVGTSEIKDLIPCIDMREGKHLPIIGALYHPPGGVVRHDAVVWGFGRGADRYGAEIHPFTEVTGITVEDGRVIGVTTPEQSIKSEIVVSATAGWSSTVSKMLDIDLPIVTHRLQAMVTEPLKPFMDTTISSANLHIYIYQTDRGEVVMGGGVDPYPTYSQRSTLLSLESLAAHAIEMFPFLGNAKILRQWGGLCDMTPDYAPIMGKIDGLDGFAITSGWGTWGFKAAPIAGKCMAELIATNTTPKMIESFGLSRFRDNKLVNERSAAPAAAIH